MREIKSIILTPLSFFGLAFQLWSGPLAESAPYNPYYNPNTTVQTATVSHEEGPGVLPADRVYVTAGTNKYSFLVPAGYRMETWANRQVALVSRDYNCQITFQLVGP